MQVRDRTERYTLVALFARIIGTGLGMRSDSLEAMLRAYRDELTQLMYTPEYTDYQRKRKKAVTTKKKKNKLGDDALLRKLEGFSASDDEMPTPASRGKKR